MNPEELGVDESIHNLNMDDGGSEVPQKENFDEKPNEYVPEAPRHETVRRIFPNKKMESPNAILNKESHKRKVMAQRKFKNKQARIARRKNRR